MSPTLDRMETSPLYAAGMVSEAQLSVPVDLNDDGLLDFTGSDVSPGNDGRYGTVDDIYNFDSLVAQPN